jgi:hypothetical protein
MITIGFFGVLLIVFAIVMLFGLIDNEMKSLKAWFSLFIAPLSVGILFIYIQCTAEYTLEYVDNIVVVTENDNTSDLDCGVWKVRYSEYVSKKWYISNRNYNKRIIEQIKKCEEVKTFTTQEK